MTRTKRKNPNRAGTDARKRKDGRYETRVTLSTPMGRQRVMFLRRAAEEGNNKKFQALADQAKGILFSDLGRLTVGEYLQSWLTDTARYQVSEGTFERYERTCHDHLVPFFGRLRLCELTAAHVRAFNARINARKIEEGLNPNTVGVMQGVLSTTLNQVVDDGLTPTNFASRMKRATKRERAPMRFLSKVLPSPGGGFEALRSRSRYARRGALITLALRTGMRQGALAALRWEDVDLAGKPSITVRRSADTRTKTRVSTTKTGKERKIHRRDSVMRSLRRLLEEADLPKNVRFHDLRHTAGTLALRQGVPLHAVSRMLGHTDPAMTLRRYAHVLEDMREDAPGLGMTFSDPTLLGPDITRLGPTVSRAIDDNPAWMGLIQTPTGPRIRIRLLRAESGLRDGTIL